MIINHGKCSYMCLCKDNNGVDALSCNEFNLKNSNEENILGIQTDRKSIF